MKLTFAQKANSKKASSRVKYPVRYSVKQAQFMLTDSGFNRLNLHDNALALTLDENSNAYFVSVPADRTEDFNCVMKGRAGKNKGLKFKAEEWRTMLNGVGLTHNAFEIEEQGEVEGYEGLKFFKISGVVTKKEEDEAADAEADADNEASISPAI